MGWFSPTYKIFLDAWNRLTAATAGYAEPIKSEKRLVWPGAGHIEGWSLDNDDPGRSRSFDLVIIDEAGLVPGLLRIWREAIRPTLVDRSGHAWFLGTPKVVCPDFVTLYDQAASGRKGWAAFRAPTTDNPFMDPREVEDARQDMPDWQYKQEYEGIPAAARLGFFAATLIDQHRRHTIDPYHTGTIRVPDASQAELSLMLGNKSDKIARWVAGTAAPEWRIWMELVGGRPPEGGRYGIGVDLSAGVGASNTVFSVVDLDKARKVAEFASPTTPPETAARLCAAAGCFFRGRGGPAVVNFEINGPGELFMRTMTRLGYPALFSPSQSTDSAGMTGGYGWRSTPQTKETLLTDYRDCLSRDRFINPSARALDELSTYHYDRGGRLVSTINEEDPMADVARTPHGDRVIADALACQLVLHAPAVALPVLPPPRDSIHERVQNALNLRNKKYLGI